MTSVPWLRRFLSTAYDVFGSATNSQLAWLMIFAILGLIASILVVIPGDQTGDGLHALYRWLLHQN